MKPQLGHGRYQCSCVECSISRSMCDAPLIEGELTIIIFLFQNAVVLAIARDTGFPSVPALMGKRSVSSRRTIRIDRPLRLAAELAPPIARKPPLKLVRRSVFCESRALGSATSPRNLGVSLT